MEELPSKPVLIPPFGVITPVLIAIGVVVPLELGVNGLGIGGNSAEGPFGGMLSLAKSPVNHR